MGSNDNPYKGVLERGKRPLRPQHLADLRKSGLSDEQIAACGFCSLVDDASVWRALNWTSAYRGQLGPCLCIPYRNPDGTLNGYCRLKPDRPRQGKTRADKGKAFKYEAPRGLPNHAYFTPGTAGLLADPTRPLLITEGEKKAAKADQEGFPCIGLSGVTCWQKKRPKGKDGKPTGPRELIDDLAAVAWQGREVFIVFDSDAATNRNVQWAEWHLARALTDRGAVPRIARLPVGPAGQDGLPSKVGLDDYLVAHSADDFRRLLQSATEPQARAGITTDGPTLIVCNNRQLRDVTADVMRAVAAANDPPQLFQRGGLLCRLRVDPGTGAPTVQALGEHALCGYLARVATWVKLAESSEGPVTINIPPPVCVVRDVASLPEWDVPVIEAVIESPAFSRGGDLITAAGYHPQARLWYQPAAGLDVPSVRPAPTPADIAQAKALVLVELFGDFPFKDDASKAHALAALLLPAVRQLIDGPTPLHLFDAPVEGTGKTLLTTVIAMVATGRAIEATAEGKDDEEWRKRITAMLAETPTFVLLDNLSRTLDSGALASVLTARTWKDRVLGHSRTATLSNTSVWMASGNNTRLSRELIRRTLWCRLDAMRDAPWERTEFRHPNLIAWTRANRNRLLWAALTLCQAWIAAGRPAGKQTLGMFESWADVIGGILDVAGVPGLLANAKDFRATSADKVSEWRAFVAAWWQEYGERPVGVAQLYQLASTEKLLDSVLGDKDDRSQRTRLGLAVGKARDRVYGTCRIAHAGEDHKSRQIYRLEKIEVPPAPAVTARAEEPCEWSA